MKYLNSKMALFADGPFEVISGDDKNVFAHIRWGYDRIPRDKIFKALHPVS